MTRRILWGMAVGLLGVSNLALAAEPSIDARALGVRESLLSYCAGVDPQDAAKLRQKIKGLLQGESKESLSQTRQSPDYRVGYDSVTAFVAKVDKHNAKQPCATAVKAGM
jgi:hypothetical protein